MRPILEKAKLADVQDAQALSEPIASDGIHEDEPGKVPLIGPTVLAEGFGT